MDTITTNFKKMIKHGTPPFRHLSDITTVIVHCTGRGVYKGTQNESIASKNAVKFYSGNTIGPHFMIDTFGAVYQFVELYHVAWHMKYGLEGWNLYQKNDWRSFYWKENEKKPAGSKVYSWWDRRWPGLASPTDIWVPKLGYPMDAQYRSVGIELIPKVNLSYTDDQYRALGDLLVWLCSNLPFFATAYHPNLLTRAIIGHEDAHPLIRVAVNQSGIGHGWDPGPLQWDIVLYNLGMDLIDIRNGELEIAGAPEGEENEDEGSQNDSNADGQG